MPRKRFFNDPKTITIKTERQKYLLLKSISNKFQKSLSELIRDAIDYYLQSQGILTSQEVTEIPNNNNMFGRDFNPGNMDTSMMALQQPQETTSEDLLLQRKLEIFKKIEIKDSGAKITSRIRMLFDCFNRITDHLPESLKDKTLIGEIFGHLKAIRTEVGKCPKALLHVEDELLKASELMADMVNEWLSGKKLEETEVRLIELKRLWKKYLQKKKQETISTT